MPKVRGDETTVALKKVWARHVKSTMKKCDLKGVDVRDAVGISAQSVSDWRSGGGLPSAQNLVDYANLVDEPISWLLADRLHGKSSTAALSHELGLRLGYGRLAELVEVPEKELLDDVDRLIGRHVSGKRKRKRRSPKNT